MPNPSNIHGYYAELDGIKRKELNLSQLWDQFKESQRHMAEHAEKVGLYKYGSVSESWQTREIIKEQIKNESI